MRLNVRRSTPGVVSAILAVSFVTSALGCTVRSRRPDGPYREAQEFVDAFSDEAVDCTRDHAPSGDGRVVVAADIAQPGAVPTIHDAGSSAGTEAVIACVQERVNAKLRSPKSAPAPFAEVRVPLPLDTSKVTFKFMRELPASGS